ncbi:MAG: IclR family transcriptional regulator domain-containing protein [Rubrivivax sp.]|jgi:DNA-binding IclR family transcriptional regulator/sugar lactone lactonase YvrE
MTSVPPVGTKGVLRPPAEGTASLDKALDILLAVLDAPEGLSQQDIAARAGLPRTTTYRLLGTLVNRGLLRRDPGRRTYGLGTRCVEMGRRAQSSPGLVAASMGELQSLRDVTGETTYLAALDGQEVVSLERCDGAHSQRSSAALGQRKPLHCTSQGKAILSALAPTPRDALVRELRLEPRTPHTLTDRRRLLAELKVCAARGWAMDDEEITLGVRCVGAPVVDAQGRVHGAISVAGPAWRITRERAELLGPEVAEAARRIGHQLRAATPVVGDPAVHAVDGPWAFWGAFPRRHRDGALYWVDRLAPELRAWNHGQDRTVVAVDAPITGLAFMGDDLVLVHERAALRVTPQGLHAPLSTWPAAPLQALCNDPQGRLWAALGRGSNGSAIGELSLGGGFKPRWCVDESVQALCWDPAGERLHAVAPGSGSLLVLHPDPLRVQRLASLPRGAGRPSGLAVDAHGGAWTALADGWSVMRVDADGYVDRVVGLPVPCPTDVAVVDGALFVTTARQAVTLEALEKAPWSGRLLKLELPG